MLKKGLVSFLSGLIVLSFLSGCGDNVSVAKGKKWEGSKIKLDTIISLAFDDVTWSAGENVLNAETQKTTFGMQEGLKNQVMIKGRISQKLHDYMDAKFEKGSKIAGFAEALRYVSKLNKDGKLAQDPNAKFDIKLYPFGENGEVDVDKAEIFMKTPENKDKVDALIAYFEKKYWEPGTDVEIVLSLVARGKVINVVAAKNVFWDNDTKYTNNFTTIMNEIFDYAQNNLPAK
jgi:hypothetical protein